MILGKEDRAQHQQREMDDQVENSEAEYYNGPCTEERWIYYAETGHVPVCWVWVTPEIGVLPDIQKESAILVKLRIKSCKLFKTGRGNNGDGCTCGWHQSGHHKDRFPAAVGASPSVSPWKL